MTLSQPVVFDHYLVYTSIIRARFTTVTLFNFVCVKVSFRYRAAFFELTVLLYAQPG